VSVDLWLLDEAVLARRRLDPLVERALSADELERYRRFRHVGAQRRYLGARLLSRHALSAYAPVAPGSWRFTRGSLGRPELEPNPWGLLFNLSHADGLIACVVTHGVPCGVDVEPAAGRERALELAPRVLTQHEQRELAATSPTERASRFADFWVLKEAYTKALGLGFGRGFQSFSLAGVPAAPALHDPTLDAAECACWQLELRRIGRHTVALALRRSGPDDGKHVVRHLDGSELLGFEAAAA
jgi:4'-phosphopantetheinyl transferase